MLKKQTVIDYFPLSVATGQAFCNRKDEIIRLQACIERQRPLLLVSPRRYGKTSLALHAIKKMKLPYAQIDLFSAIDERDIERAILKGASQLILRMETGPRRALALASKIFEGTHIRVSLTKVDLSIAISRRKEKPAYHVLDILERLEKLTEKTNKKIILFFDEFQHLSEAAPNRAMEGVLRQVAQLTKSISFIFSGSNRHLLNQLFNDRNRPFYKLCEKITLERISESAYEKHIQKAAKNTWKVTLSDRFLECLFNYSERHPYYLNLLCSRMWGKKPPTIQLIDETWCQYKLEERSSVAAEIELLSKNQRKLLTVLSRTEGVNEPLGKEFIHQANMSKTTISQSLKFLEQKDYIYREGIRRVKVLDPLIKSVLED